MDEVQMLEQKAIDAAIKSNWNEAITLNKNIIELDKNNSDAYLRLAFAYFQSNLISEAKKFYKKALTFQPGNLSIIENLERIKIIQSRKSKIQTDKKINLDPNLFLETPGKTKSIQVVNPGQKNILAQLSVGQEIIMVPKKRKVEIRTKSKEYIGSLPDDISKRLTIFLKAGSEFNVYIKESNLSKVTVFIKEEKKGKKVMKYTSFPTNIQARLSEISQSQDEDDDVEEPSENDLDKLAEVLATEEKEYMPYVQEEQEEEPEE